MSTAKHHAEWLSLMEISGPFLSMPVLQDAFPQGLNAYDSDEGQQIKAAYEEWGDNQGGLQPERAIHQAWLRFVLTEVLGMPDEVIAREQAIPETVKVTLAEHAETIRPDIIIADPDTNKPHLLIHTYPADQELNKTVPGRNRKASPASRMMELLHATEIRLGLVTNGEQWMLVQAKRGTTTGFISWYAGLWQEERLTLRAFQTLLGVERFFGVPDDQTLPALLDASEKDQHEVTDQLGYQVRSAVEILIQAIDRADIDRGRTLLTDVTEARLYEAALTVMMRLVFLLSAEERGLLLLGDPIYDQYYAVSTLRGQLRTQADQLGEEVVERGLDAWCRLLATFRAVYSGIQHENLTLPAYGGSLFDPDRFPFLEGRQLETEWEEVRSHPLPINNRTVLHLLEALQILRVQVPGGGSAEARRLSFRALDIEQIGHVYEGLLDHWAVRAEEPVVGLTGTKDKEPELPLTRLEAAREKSDKALIELLAEETGRSTSALHNNLDVELDNLQKEQLRTACDNQEELYERVLPYAGLLREDAYGQPIVISAGSVYVTAGNTRRATGTHYTPRSLTEPIVQHTLEPLVYEGPAEGKPREAWRLRPPAELLNLKVCDMAMGSGAFLVQTCRYLSERLVEAWEKVQPVDAPTQLQITPEGTKATGDPQETIIPSSDEERLMLAKRLVADRCLYGVDKNHLAVEMGKLSLWLITLDKSRPFTFLDHALRHGDSIIGTSKEMFLRWPHNYKDSTMSLFGQEVNKLVKEAQEKRQALRGFEVRDMRDAEQKERLLHEAEELTERIRYGCDLLAGVHFLEDLNKRETEGLLAEALLQFNEGQEFNDPRARRAVRMAQEEDALHWHFEFPEVFANSGFSAFVGNPPFIGGKKIRDNLGDGYRAALYSLYKGSSGNADYSAFFFLQAHKNLQRHGSIGLIATNTIAQGDTLSTGLEPLHEAGSMIYLAHNNYPWPGKAAVVVNIVLLYKGSYKGTKFLDDEPVDNITPALDDRLFYGTPFQLEANSGISYIGSITRGMGFVVTEEEAQKLLKVDEKNRQVVKPYLNGQDLNNSPNQTASRWVIDYKDWSLAKAEKFSEPMRILRERVYPDRMDTPKKRKTYENKWWQLWRPRIELYEKLDPLTRAIAISRVSSNHSMAFSKTDLVFSDRLVILILEGYGDFALLSSSIHDEWAHRPGSTTHETRKTYFPQDAFETFPFPKSIVILDSIGYEYNNHRQQLMLNNGEGLTKTYNRFHDPDETSEAITTLRHLHVELDQAVAAAYGWQDLNLGHDFYETAQGIRYTISEAARRQVLTRLLKLNHQRYEEEQAEQESEKKKVKSKKSSSSKKSKSTKKNDNQLTLF